MLIYPKFPKKNLLEPLLKAHKAPSHPCQQGERCGLASLAGAGVAYLCAGCSTWWDLRVIEVCEEEERAEPERPGERSWVASLEPVGVTTTFTTLPDTCISLTRWQKDCGNDCAICRHVGAFWWVIFKCWLHRKVVNGAGKECSGADCCSLWSTRVGFTSPPLATAHLCRKPKSHLLSSYPASSPWAISVLL